ncbi:MAG: rhodanese-like domain-containing protein [Gammaproteobacteria bacterium]|nr:rhodanese-like domain-containing protein [Gammaproteobacteria bacterium]
MTQLYFLLGLSLGIFAFASSAQANTDGFPGRAEFPQVKNYTKEDLNKDFNQVLIVDTRSNYEFETIHINTAINIPVSRKDFVAKVREIRKTTNKTIVFYCNGRTCYKSYKAAKAAMDNGIENVFAYDAGMFEWAKAYPDKSTLLGHSPLNPANLLSKATLKAHTLSPKAFTEMVYSMGDKAMVIDIRDTTQRANGVGYFIGFERWISLNQKEQVIKRMRQAAKAKKTLLIYDAVGKQVRWLQYTLEKEKIKDYYFMAKGAMGFYNDIINIKH